MAFIGAFIGAIAGLGAVGTAIVSAGIAVGLSFISKRLTPKQSPLAGTNSAQERGARISLRIDPAAPRQVIMGQAATAGSLVYWQLSGTNNFRLHMVIALADHECEDIVTNAVWVDNKKRTLDTGSDEVSGFDGKLRIRFYRGTAAGAVDSAVQNASNGRWTANEKGRYCSYAVVACDYDEKKFAGGIPQITFVVKGAKLYDPRFDTTAGGSGSQIWSDPATWVYTTNPAVMVYNVLRGLAPGGVPLIGMNVPAAAIRYADYAAAANACDEAIALGAGGTEPRYRAGAVFDTSQTNRDILETLLASMAGEIVETGGIYRIMAGVAQPTVAALTDTDLIVDQPFISEPRLPRSQLSNAVLGTYSDPSRAYALVSLPPRTSSVDEDEDGGIRLSQSLDLTAVTSRTQAQRVMEIERRRARRQLRVSCTLRARWSVLEPGDWITLTSDRRGYVSRAFVVEQKRRNADLTTEVILRETDAAVDDWNVSLEIDDNEVIDLQSAGPPLNAVTGFALINITVTGGGTAQRPGLQAQWTPITDPTVPEIVIEYRKVGDTVALERRVVNTGQGAYTWLDGVLEGVTYEARARPAPVPERATEWTPWTAAPAPSQPQIVTVAAEALYIDPANIPPAELDPQSALELAIAYQAALTIGDLEQSVTDAVAQIQQAAETALLASMAANTAAAAVSTEVTERIAGDASLAGQITTLTSTVDGQSVQIVEIAQAIDGIEGRWGVAVTQNGQILGLVQLDGGNGTSQFTVVADRFQVAFPDQTGGDPVPVFGISMVNGVPKLAIRGDMIADGAIAARMLSVVSLTALTANFGNAQVTGYLTGGPGGKLVIDLTNGRIRGVA